MTYCSTDNKSDDLLKMFFSLSFSVLIVSMDFPYNSIIFSLSYSPSSFILRFKSYYSIETTLSLCANYLNRSLDLIVSSVTPESKGS